VFGLPDTAQEFYEGQERLRLLNRKEKLAPFPKGTSLPLKEVQDDF
jgi:hypothetical protein